MAAAPAPSTGLIRYGTPAARWILLGTILGSGMALLDGTVVNVALPTIGRDFNAPLADLQWTVNAYTLTLAGFLLLGGSLGDHFGRRRLFVIGVVWFAAGSLLCGLAPSTGALIAARAFQGIGAALLTPASLAIIEATFEPDGRGAAIGAWSGLGGVAAAIGPFVGGWLVSAVSWRLVFFINLPLAVLTAWVAIRHIPETRNEQMRTLRLDIAGAALAALGLAGVTYALTEAQGGTSGSAAVALAAVVGVAALAGFVVRERKTDHPLIPLGLFSSLQFTAANAVTFLVYAALGAALFLIPIELQQVLGYTPTRAGLALVPQTLVMLVLSSRAGALAERVGPRLPMTVGPLVAGLGLIMLVRVGPDSSYAADILPAVLVFGLGLAITVAPLTSAVLAAGSEENAGVSSAVNNDVARVAGLIAVAVVPLVAGLSGDSYRHPAAFNHGFHVGVVLCGALCIAGGLLAYATIRRAARPAVRAEPASYCAIGAPPLLRGDTAVAADRA
jgi:EmrB/QacA subfamily drug resistance transporter